MSLPDPEPGLVVAYSYLWLSDHQRGREEGSKDRPCAILLAVVQTDGDQRVVVVPITHSAPRDPETAVELPAAVKRRLGLDDARSWVVLTESNEFTWPGPDLRHTSRNSGTVSFGFLRRRFLELEHSRRARRVPRSE